MCKKSEKFNRKRANMNLQRIIGARNLEFTPFVHGNIKLENFSYAYANNLPVLKDINLEFKEGCI